ncbi:carboxymuconolactone decarboxylase family protein [Thalassotalea sediminis]|uniref:carboxymuconolactone decarboxylase family protein n=1 Tax=Thalassotalea sediminis TaxID=1759089 RepID=UPI0025724586|nr:carboxymuconolactone decarboxylase family protein [Thalassotalea sediminis]
MQPRLSPENLYKNCPRVPTHLIGLGKLADNETLSKQLLHLVKLRASQINHCGFCQKMHADEARADGEQQSRLDVLSAWRELSCFTAQERAALAWTEALTLIASEEITDQTYQQVTEAFGEQGVVELTTVILEINSWNRISVGFGFQPEIKA